MNDPRFAIFLHVQFEVPDSVAWLADPGGIKRLRGGEAVGVEYFADNTVIDHLFDEVGGGHLCVVAGCEDDLACLGYRAAFKGDARL